MISSVLNDVLIERRRQDKRWGEQNHQNSRWTHILGEEYGEACRAVNDLVWPGKLITDGEIETRIQHLREELVQVAAVAVAWIECIDRRKGRASQEEVSH